MITKMIWKGVRKPIVEDNLVIMSTDGEIWSALPLYLEEVNHSPTGFEWGYYGSGPAQLAYAILRSYFEIFDGHLPEDARRYAQKHYFKFKEDIVAKWQDVDWEITSDELDVWIGGERYGWL